MVSTKIKNLYSFLKNTPLHPQWFTFRDFKLFYDLISDHCNGITLDIGCGDRRIEKIVNTKHQYIGLDYYKTSVELYKSLPNIFANAENLPLKDVSVDTILLLEVLEHIPNPQNAIAESYRVLKNGGSLIISTPFLYPIHDAPYDYQRWTKYGLDALLKKNSFEILHREYRGDQFQSAALIFNIASGKLALNLFEKNIFIFIIVMPILGILIPLSNIVGWLFSFIFKKDEFMPFGYRIIATKQLNDS